MTMPGEGFPKAARVRRRREYLSIGRTGRRCHTPHFVVLSDRRSGGARLGVTVSRKVGGAVTRNYVKRCVREIFRRDEARLWPEHDVVVIAKPGAGELDCGEIALQLRAAIAKAERSTRN
jgi:ribonuclease P protein component